jgi:hypothetical protein
MSLLAERTPARFGTSGSTPFNPPTVPYINPVNVKNNAAMIAIMAALTDENQLSRLLHHFARQHRAAQTRKRGRAQSDIHANSSLITFVSDGTYKQSSYDVARRSDSARI